MCHSCSREVDELTSKEKRSVAGRLMCWQRKCIRNNKGRGREVLEYNGRVKWWFLNFWLSRALIN